MSSKLFQFVIAVVLLVLVLGEERVAGQPTITSRTVVSLGEVDYPVNETTVAAYGDKLVAIWNVDQPVGQAWGPYRMGYAVSENGGQSWTDMGIFPRPDGCTLEQFDPTVVANPFGEFAGDFFGGGVVNGCAGGSGKRGHVGRMLDGESEFDDSLALSNGGFNCHTDYTHLAAGPDPSDPEGSTHLYMTCFTLAGDANCSPWNIGLFRSVDAGENWSSRSIVEVNNTPVADALAAWPVVGPDGTLYIAYNDRPTLTNPKIHLIANSSAGSGQFTNLALEHARIQFSFPNQAKLYGDYIPGEFRVGHNLQVAADPTDSSVLYVVYHDFVTAPEDPEDDADIDVYLIRGEYNSQSEEWDWSSRIRVNDDDPDVEQDQFFPTIVVDDYGDLHIAWFDTRNDPQPAAASVEISLFYAFSDDGGQTFTNYEVDEVAIDTFLLQEPDFIGDYIRITMSGDVAVIVSNATGPLPGPFFPLTYVEQIHSARIEWE